MRNLRRCEGPGPWGEAREWQQSQAPAALALSQKEPATHPALPLPGCVAVGKWASRFALRPSTLGLLLCKLSTVNSPYLPGLWQRFSVNKIICCVQC